LLSNRIPANGRPDIRNVISDDDLLQEGIQPALREYNIEQFTVVDVPDTNHQVRLF
jgi:capping protein alpha